MKSIFYTTFYAFIFPVFLFIPTAYSGSLSQGDPQAIGLSVLSDCFIPTDELELSGSADNQVTVVGDGSYASAYQPGENIEKSFDGDKTTLYHSPWNNNTRFPVYLNYHFDGDTPIDYIKYIPRSDGGTNGDFGKVLITYNTVDDDFYVDLMEYDFAQEGLPAIVELPAQITPLNIEFIVYDGAGDYASCAEMEFYTRGMGNGHDIPSGIFADEICAELEEGISQAQIDTIASSFYRELAQCLFDESYNLRYRVREHEVYLPLNQVHRELKVSGYSPYENPTGIVFKAGEKIALFAADIPSGAGVHLLVKDHEEGYYGETSYYLLQNGLNVLEIEQNGLGYISYYNSNLALPNVKINIVSGEVNGVFDYEKSEESDWYELLNITSYPKMDIVGEYAHLIYDRDALIEANAGSGLDLLAKYDEINRHERLLMGLFKYDRSPKNRIMAFGEYGGGYYAGGLGIHLDWTWGIPSMADPERLDLWGIPHEFGHVNQIRPDLKWIGTTEVTNNIYSVWVYYHMNPEGKKYTRLEEETISPGYGIPAVQGGRINGTINSTYVHGKPLQDDENYDVFNVLVPFWQLELYYQLAGAGRDAPELTMDYPGDYDGTDYARWYGTVAEISRNTNSTHMTNGELAMNFVKNTCDAVEEDLSEFFVHTGFLKPINVTLDDYGLGDLVITQEMVDETLAYIASQGYEKPVSPVINYMSAHTMEIYKNRLKLEGKNGEGVTKMGGNIRVLNEAWPHAVAFECYDGEGELIHVAIKGTGDVSTQNTTVFYPAEAGEVYAVGYDGDRRLVYPESTATETVINGENEFLFYPNPLQKGEKIHLKNEIGSAEMYPYVLYDLDGRKLIDGHGRVESIERALNDAFNSVESGVYLLKIGKGYQILVEVF